MKTFQNIQTVLGDDGISIEKNNITFQPINKVSQELIDMMIDMEILQDKIQTQRVPGLEFLEAPRKRILSYHKLNSNCSGVSYIKKDNEIIGYYQANKSEFYKKAVALDVLYIKEQYRKLGVGKITLDHIKNEFKNNGCKFILLGYSKGNDSAQHLYGTNDINIEYAVNVIGSL